MEKDNENTEYDKTVLENTERRFAEADEKTMGILADYLGGGFCETLAKIAVYLGKERADSLLAKLPAEIKAGVEKALAGLEGKTRTDPAIIVVAANVLKNAGFYGKSMAKSVMDGMGPNEFSALYAEHERHFERNPVLAINIDHYAFPFDIITEMDDRSTQRMLREVDTQDLAKALKGADGAIQKKIFSNMSRRAAAMLKEDIEFLGPVRLRDVAEAQRKVLDVIRRLDERGDIVIARLGNEGLVY
ncbi:MAG: hypothetical protein J1E59_01440 [Treponema sp.]|nr:hypothetical protein [Treponema sp.]